MDVRRLARALAVRAMLLALGWFTIADGATASVTFGAAVVPVATAISMVLSAPSDTRTRPLPLARLMGFFVVGSLRGGIDVAIRALSPHLCLSPTLVRYRSKLPSGRLQLLFVTMISLMPGTQSVDLQDGALLVHLLVRRNDTERDLASLEAHIAAAFRGGGDG